MIGFLFTVTKIHLLVILFVRSPNKERKLKMFQVNNRKRVFWQLATDIVIYFNILWQSSMITFRQVLFFSYSFRINVEMYSLKNMKIPTMLPFANIRK